MDSLADAFDAAVLRHPDRIALIDGQGRATSFAGLKALADGFAVQCRARGIGAGDRAVIAMPVGPGLYAALCGLWQVGAVAVFPEPAMGLRGLRHAVRVTKPSAFISGGWYRLLGWIIPELIGLMHLRVGDQARGQTQPGAANAEAPALISFTSGTTGQPKAMARSHAFLFAQYRALAPILESERDDRDLVAFPVMALINLAEGRTSVLPNWRLSRPEAVTGERLHRWIADQGVTRLLIPPVLCAALAGSGGPGAVRTIFTGGGPVFPDIVKQLSRPGTRVVSVYGSTEAEPIARVESDEISAEDQRAMEAGCGILAGHPVPGLSLRIEDDEIQVSGAHVNQGYFDPSHDADTKLHQDGVVWHRTGDAGRLDGEGRLWLLGRLQDRFHAPGGPIYPFAVEVVARTWPGVDAAAFLAIDAVPILAVSGDAANLAEWEEAAKDCGIARVTAISEIPMDRRHRSKVDARTLAKRIKAKLGRVS